VVTVSVIWSAGEPGDHHHCAEESNGLTMSPRMTSAPTFGRFLTALAEPEIEGSG
jgi:hypothetical protein